MHYENEEHNANVVAANVVVVVVVVGLQTAKENPNVNNLLLLWVNKEEKLNQIDELMTHN
jgi:hypothetical protein